MNIYRPIGYVTGLVALAAAFLGCGGSAEVKDPSLDSIVSGYDTEKGLADSAQKKLEAKKKESLKQIDALIANYETQLHILRVNFDAARTQQTLYQSNMKRYETEKKAKVQEMKDRKMADTFVDRISVTYDGFIIKEKTEYGKVSREIKGYESQIRTVGSQLDKAVRQRHRIDPTGMDFSSAGFRPEAGYVPVPGYGPGEKEKKDDKKDDKSKGKTPSKKPKKKPVKSKGKK